ncbi:ubiquitin conjugating enzyme [Pyrenophora seminiperda CCB06]|uniref:Ubiquitin conjugating enzyme n=1 Tax=Pyrenophora seminiperda CCB06 TaxID=1302712 RepID=A0A3M7MGY4_9PLEO|nr:ubiquitin conjugating enzyme [Pyrenophora seminiperda CCB06]
MPRRHFQADLQKAAESISVAGISDVRPGDDDGEFTFMCMADGQKLQISAHIQDVSDYPSRHTCMIFGADSTSTSVAAALNALSDVVTGKTIHEILEQVSMRLKSTDSDGDHHMLDSLDSDDFDEGVDEDEEEYFPGDEDLMPSKPRIPNSTANSGSTEASAVFKQRVRNDLWTAKSHGFKVGYLGGLMDGLPCYVSLSIRISKLGISEEAMQAWHVAPSEYLVAILHYPSGYRDMDDVRSYDTHQARRNFGIRVGICTTYKPSLSEAGAVFSVHGQEDAKRQESQKDETQNASTVLPTGFRNSFISRPLNELLDQRFHMLLKYRYGGMPWQGSEMFYNEQIQTASHTHRDASHARYYAEEEIRHVWPKVVTDDHISTSISQEHSLPLVVMQFVLRHFVRCTEFCLICFSKMPDDLQAIKPYVCDNPLCLYQYMSLGFGPSIEHEILSQPKVVDLLVSFCYISARSSALRDFPTGLCLAVPPPTAFEKDYMPISGDFGQAYLSGGSPTATGINMRYNAVTHEMLFDNHLQACPVSTGNWVAIHMRCGLKEVLHCRVIDASCYPAVKLSHPVVPQVETYGEDAHKSRKNGSQQSQVPPQKQAPTLPPKPEFRPASFHVYNNNFDDLQQHQKAQAIAALLDLLPPIQEMREYLLRKNQSTLSSWVNRLSPAVVGILRWVIASNRACILQIDDTDAANDRKSEDRVYGMSGWAQFRFAMGAPDKERRFTQAVQETTSRLGLKYPTIFAWHGSPLKNWHSIIREGLNFKEVQHGRAYGDGVYHSIDVNTSITYSAIHGGSACWPRSELKIQQALALNEIVNAPAEYTSRTPHLVVAQLDWIQTRYLFVQTSDGLKNVAVEDNKPLARVEQDPHNTPRGVDGHLIIPIHAIAASRRPKTKSTVVSASQGTSKTWLSALQRGKRQKISGKSKYDPIVIEDDEGDDTASVATLDEDRAIFQEDDENQLQQTAGFLPTPNSVTNDKDKSKMSAFSSSSRSLTDYVPGTLDYSTLPILQAPLWATPTTSKRLMKEIKILYDVQNREPLHELGWHIDPANVDNVYQWIVELHSFDASLPLAKDMKKQGVKSIVLELRFGNDYPMSPPFVRVIRPRFLGFAQGGGGHVTAGGAMCMQLLTNDGWIPVSSIESVLLQVRMAISSLDPRPARLQPGSQTNYGVGEAVEAFLRACAVHGWTVPAGFKEMAYGGQVGSH